MSTPTFYDAPETDSTAGPEVRASQPSDIDFETELGALYDAVNSTGEWANTPEVPQGPTEPLSATHASEAAHLQAVPAGDIYANIGQGPERQPSQAEAMSILGDMNVIYTMRQEVNDTQLMANGSQSEWELAA